MDTKIRPVYMLSPGEWHGSPLQYSYLPNIMDGGLLDCSPCGCKGSGTTEVTECVYCLQKTDIRLRDTYRLKLRGQKKVFQANKNQKKDGLAILIPVKTDIKIKTIARDKEGHYIMIEELIQKEDITFANAYAPNRGAY